MPVHVLGINGSIVPGSTADRALQLFLRALQQRGADTETFDISQLPALDRRPDDQYPPAVAVWKAACTRSDALVISAPSYHGAPPGSVKNALDFIDRPEMGGKPFAVIGIAGGDAEPVVADLTRVMRYIGGIAGVLDVIVSRSNQRWGRGEQPEDPALASAIENAAAGLFALCELRATGQLPSP